MYMYFSWKKKFYLERCKAQISLHLHTVWSAPLQSAYNNTQYRWLADKK